MSQGKPKRTISCGEQKIDYIYFRGQGEEVVSYDP